MSTTAPNTGLAPVIPIRLELPPREQLEAAKRRHPSQGARHA